MSNERAEATGSCTRCEAHPQAEAVGRCLECGRPVCTACVREVGRKIYCPDHASGREGAPVCAPSGEMAFGANDFADFWTKAIAYILDGLILAFIVSLIFRFSVTIGAPESNYLGFLIRMNVFFTLFFGVYCTVLVGSRGQTIGHALVGIRVVGSGGEPIGYWRAFLRWLGYFLCTFSLFVGFLMSIRDPHQRGWHDRIAGTVVVGKSLSLPEKVLSTAGLAFLGLPLLMLILIQIFAPY